MKRKLLLLLIIVLLVAFSSCSIVFKGGIGGNVTDKSSDEPIEGMRVFAYLSESARNTDYQSWSDNSSLIGDSEIAIGSATTDANGNFSIGSVIWNQVIPNLAKLQITKKYISSSHMRCMDYRRIVIQCALAPIQQIIRW